MKLLGKNKKNAEVSTKPKTPENKQATDGKKKKGFFLPYEKTEKKKGFFLPFESKDKYDSKRGFFRRSSRKMKAPDAKEILQEKPAEETRAPPTPEAKAAPMTPVAEEVPKQAEPSPKQSEPVVPETVHSADHEDMAQSPKAASPKAKTEDAPVAEERSPRNEEHHDKEEEERPAEPEGRSEEAEGEAAEKNTTNAADSREQSERTDSKMSVEEPSEEATGLLCGCI